MFIKSMSGSESGQRRKNDIDVHIIEYLMLTLVAQSDSFPTGYFKVTSLILVSQHSFVEIDHEIFA